MAWPLQASRLLRRTDTYTDESHVMICRASTAVPYHAVMCMLAVYAGVTEWRDKQPCREGRKASCRRWSWAESWRMKKERTRQRKEEVCSRQRENVSKLKRSDDIASSDLFFSRIFLLLDHFSFSDLDCQKLRSPRTSWWSLVCLS